MVQRRRPPEAVVGVFGPLLFIASWVVAGLLRDDYDITSDSISRLAEYGAPNRWIVLTGTVVVSIAALMLGALLRKRWGIRWGMAAIVLAGTSALALAVFPCSPGCPGIGGELTDKGHSISAVVHYISFGLTPIVVALEARRYAGRRYLAASVIAGLIAGVFFLSQFTGWGPNGITQRVGLTTLDLWMVATASQFWSFERVAS